MAYFPLFLKLKVPGSILVVGGGNVAFAKIEAMLPYAAYMRIVAPESAKKLMELASKHRIPLMEKSYDSSLLDGVSVVVAATDDEQLNRQIQAEAAGRGILVNVVDRRELCDVIFPAIVRRGPLQIAISSSGVSPVLARLVKQRIERLLPWNFDALIQFVEKRRVAVKVALDTIQRKRLLWQRALDGGISEAVLEGNEAQADQLFNELLSSESRKQNHASLYLVGAGPGNPDLITVKAIRLLSQADVVLYDRLIAPQLLTQYARTEAEKIPVGKTRNLHLRTQKEIDLLIEDRLREGKVVVRLKGGDPGVYAHLAEEVAVAKKLNVPYQIVPGISAANGCASYAGVPLTERDGAQAVRYLTVYGEQVHDATFWGNLSPAAKDTLVFYMSTKQRGVICQKLLERGFHSSTPVLAIEQGTTPSHREYEAPLGEFEERFKHKQFISPTLLIVGDVVRWRHTHGWKEQGKDALPFFDSLNEESVHVIH